MSDERNPLICDPPEIPRGATNRATRVPRITACAVMAAIACKAPTADDATLLQPLTTRTSAELWARGGTSAITEPLRLLSLNDYGARAPGDRTSVSVDEVQTEIQPDNTGLVELRLDTPGSHLVRLPSGEALSVNRTSAASPTLRLDKIATDNIPGSTWWSTAGGAFSFHSGRVWRHDPARGAEPVLSMDGAGPDNVFTAILDEDALPDLVVHDARRLFVLRGVEDGGFVWGAGFNVGAARLGGVSATDFDGDGRTDLIVAASTLEESDIRVYRNTGLLRFSADEVIDPVVLPASLVTSRAGDELALEAMSSQGEYIRMERSGGENWTITEDHTPVDVEAGTRLVNGGDFDGDGRDDAWIVGPKESGVARLLVYVDHRQRPLSFVERTPTGADYAFGDGDGDGKTELFTRDERGTLRMLSTIDDRQVEWEVGSGDGEIGLAVTDFNADGVIDLLGAASFGARVRFGGPDTDAPWRPRARLEDEIVADLVDAAPLASTPDDLPGDLHIAGVQVRDGEAWLKIWRRVAEDGTVAEQSRQRITAAASSLEDARICGETAWALADGRLWRFSLLSPLAEPVELRGFASGRIACRADGWGAVLSAGSAFRFGPDGAELTPIATPDATSIALDDADPPGVVSCDAEACAVAAWVAGSQRLTVVGAETTSWSGDSDRALPLAGAPSIEDVDGDGADDLIVVSPDGWITWVQQTPNGPADPFLWLATRPLGTRAFLADVDGDLAPELLAIDADGTLFVTLPPT